ncbi:MAG: glycosyltransferase, partial [Anaerolineae bacterium]|nr:glycosyltransferase [Anaerolineae bacterium]
MKVSLVFTVLNESRSIKTLLDSIAVQTLQPDEVVVCDGGSSDATVNLLRSETRFPIRVIEERGANISRGRNLAIAAAQGELIACTDAGVRLDARWLERLVDAWMHDDSYHASTHPRIHASAGFFLPDPHTTFEVAMSATVLPQASEIDPQKFLPSSRSVAFTKSAWQQVGGYPEWLDYCEDLIFDLNLCKAFGPFAFAPQAIAHFRPRGSLKSFIKQYYLYARGDGKANLFFKRHLIRYGTYLIALPLLLVGIASSSWFLVLGSWLLLLMGFVAYHKTPYQRLTQLWKNLPLVEKLK